MPKSLNIYLLLINTDIKLGLVVLPLGTKYFKLTLKCFKVKLYVLGFTIPSRII